MTLNINILYRSNFLIIRDKMTNEQKDEAKRKNREQKKKKYQEDQAAEKWRYNSRKPSILYLYIVVLTMK